ncbi:TRAP transporter substrate-binding protein [Bacillus taeanensis]|uniref:TRAP transporter substrate-binding protein n=1 Tax=Bacillus taeanensis TaxID=273032 RepID=A0A366XW97_9BACI|nr:TRAP transporter substrate-binding protein [Bacillus taeanensis]RBW70680.1 TRAP transporter substrate-binding protein [Bacillus taeanensis]
MKKILNFSLLLCILLLGACSGQASDSNKDGTKTMKLAVATSKDRSLTQGLYKFEEIVEKETNGSIDVEVYPDGQLGGDRVVFEGLKIGSIQGTTMSTGPIASFESRFTVFDLPYLFKDETEAYEVLDGSIGEELLNDLPEQGVIGLNYWENGFRQLTNNVREVKTVGDIKGLKIRTLENELHVDMWKELGANPTPIPYPELFTALEQRIVDGQENPAGNITTGNFYEVQKYLTKTNHIYNASVFMISEKFWNTLSDEEKEIVTKAAEEAKEYQRELNQQESEDAYAFLAAEGMVVTELGEEELQKMFEAVQPVYEKYSSEIGEEFVSKLLEAVK